MTPSKLIQQDYKFSFEHMARYKCHIMSPERFLASLLK